MNGGPFDICDGAALDVADALSGALHDQIRIGQDGTISELEIHVGRVRRDCQDQVTHACTPAIGQQVIRLVDGLYRLGRQFIDQPP